MIKRIEKESKVVHKQDIRTMLMSKTGMQSLSKTENYLENVKYPKEPHDIPLTGSYSFSQPFLVHFFPFFFFKSLDHYLAIIQSILVSFTLLCFSWPAYSPNVTYPKFPLIPTQSLGRSASVWTVISCYR